MCLRYPLKHVYIVLIKINKIIFKPNFPPEYPVQLHINGASVFCHFLYVTFLFCRYPLSY